MKKLMPLAFADHNDSSGSVALCIEKLVPAAEYFGSVTGNTKEQYDSLEWKDLRGKPTWEEIQSVASLVRHELLLSRFNPSLAISREAQVFSAVDLVRFAPIGYNINELIRFKNFWGGVTAENVPYVGLKQFCQAAIASGTGMFTQNDYDRLNGILKEQGIDLDNPPA